MLLSGRQKNCNGLYCCNPAAAPLGPRCRQKSVGVGPCLRGESFFGHLNVPHVTFKSVLPIVENALRDRSKMELSIVIFVLGELWGQSRMVSFVVGTP